MPLWTSNNLACLNVWSTTYVMKQHKKTFKNAELLKMKELLFYNPLLTKDELTFEAEGIADFFDKVFKNTCAATYEENVTKSLAMEAMVNVLIDGNKTMADLAAIVDDNYKF